MVKDGSLAENYGVIFGWFNEHSRQAITSTPTEKMFMVTEWVTPKQLLAGKFKELQNGKRMEEVFVPLIAG